MRKVIYLNENDLQYIVESVVNETLETQLNEGRLGRMAGTALLAASSLMPGKAKAQSMASQDSTENKTEYVANNDSTQQSTSTQDKNTYMTRPQMRQANRQDRRDARQANRQAKRDAKQAYKDAKDRVDSTYNARMKQLKDSQKANKEKAKAEQKALDAKMKVDTQKSKEAEKASKQSQEASERFGRLKQIEDDHMKKYGDLHIHSAKDYRQTKRKIRRANR